MSGASAITGLFENLINVGTVIAVTVAAFFVLVGAFMYMTAAGSPRQMEAGKSAIVNALFGLAIALGARTIAAMISGALGGGAGA